MCELKFALFLNRLIEDYITGFTVVGTLGIQFGGLLVMFIVSRYCCSFCVIRP